MAGLGRLQRMVLEALSRHAATDPVAAELWPLTMRRLTAELLGPAPTRSERESLRQAIDALERRGLVETYWPPRGSMFGGRRVVLRPGEPS